MKLRHRARRAAATNLFNARKWRSLSFTPNEDPRLIAEAAVGLCVAIDQEVIDLLRHGPISFGALEI